MLLQPEQKSSRTLSCQVSPLSVHFPSFYSRRCSKSWRGSFGGKTYVRDRCIHHSRWEESHRRGRGSQLLSWGTEYWIGPRRRSLEIHQWTKSWRQRTLPHPSTPLRCNSNWQQDIKDCLSPSSFTKFSIVIATDLDEPTSLALSKILHDLNIPLILVRSIGFIGSFRIIVPEHTSHYPSRNGVDGSCGDSSWGCGRSEIGFSMAGITEIGIDLKLRRHGWLWTWSCSLYSHPTQNSRTMEGTSNLPNLPLPYLQISSDTFNSFSSIPRKLH